MAKRKRKASKRINTFGFILIVLISVAIVYTWNYTHRSPAPKHFISLPTSFNSYGIDVSHHQNKINWDIVFTDSDSLISFVYCKATEGLNHVDSQWKRNRVELSKKKIPHGAYHFFLPKKSAKKQAYHFLANYELIESDLPPVLDAEIEGMSEQHLVNQMKIWLEIIENKTGRRPVIYTSYNMYSQLLKSNFKNYKFWVANYSLKTNRFHDEQIIHWQYSDNGSINGIDGEVDLNFSKIEF